MRKITIEFDHLPNSILYPNATRRVHWSKRAEATKIAREEAYYICKGIWSSGDPIDNAEIEYIFYLKSRRRRDICNLIEACKPYIDGIVDCGVIADDDINHVATITARAIHSTEDKTVICVKGW